MRKYLKKKTLNKNINFLKSRVFKKKKNKFYK